MSFLPKLFTRLLLLPQSLSLFVPFPRELCHLQPEILSISRHLRNNFLGFFTNQLKSFGQLLHGLVCPVTCHIRRRMMLARRRWRMSPASRVSPLTYMTDVMVP